MANGVLFQEIHDGTQQTISIFSKTLALAKKLPNHTDEELRIVTAAETHLALLKESFEILVIENRERKQREKQELFESCMKITTVLKALFPVSFPSDRYKIRPLAIGIDEQILAILDIDRYLLSHTLRHWCNTTAYLYAVKNGTERINLDGSGTRTAPTQEQRDQALQRIKRRFGKISNRT